MTETKIKLKQNFFLWLAKVIEIIKCSFVIVAALTMKIQ